MLEHSIKRAVVVLGVVLCLYTLAMVNYSVVQPQSELALFVMLGLVLSFLVFPLAEPVGEGKSFTWGDALRCAWRKGRILVPRRAATAARGFDVLLAATTVVCFGYLFVQTEPWSLFRAMWSGGQPLGNRAGVETPLDFWIGAIGLALVLEATRRSIGVIVPLLSIAFLAHAYFAPNLPDWMFPHAGKSATQLVSATFLQSLGVLGPAAGVMFKYVFLFVVFGAFLEMSGATQFVIDFAQRLFGRSRGGPALVSVMGSGLMGSLSGSAVANAVTTGSFTIPMMRSAGFQPHVAGGITAAAAAGGALVPPVMGAGAYMMLEFVERAPGQPQLTFLEIVRAAIIPAVLYYLSIGMIVFFHSRKLGMRAAADSAAPPVRLAWFEGVVFFGALAVLVGLLVMGLSPFKAVTASLVYILVMSAMRPKLNLGFVPRVLAIAVFCLALLGHQAVTWSGMEVPDALRPFRAPAWFHPGDQSLSLRMAFDSLLNSSLVGMFALLVFGVLHPAWRPEVVKAFTRSAGNGIALVAASACVGIIIGVVQCTPVANEFSETIKGVVEWNLLLALVGIMICSLVLGMGVPSVVCYLLMATLMGSLLKEMGVDPLAAHLFIFYYGMMSMVTPPVALAAYASASIAEAPIMQTAVAAFRFSLVGFALPFMFVYRPALLLMNAEGGPLFSPDLVHGVTSGSVPATELALAVFWLVVAIVVSVLGIVALSAAVVGFFKAHLGALSRALLLVSAIALLAPHLGGRQLGLLVNIGGAALFVAVLAVNWRKAGAGKRSVEGGEEKVESGKPRAEE